MKLLSNPPAPLLPQPRAKHQGCITLQYEKKDNLMLTGSANKIVIKSTRMKHKPEYCSHCATQAKRPRRVVFADKKVCITNTTGLGQP